MSDSISDWLNQEEYIKHLQSSALNYAPTVAVLRSLSEWQQLSERIKPGNQNIHMNVPAILDNNTLLTTAWFGSDPRLTPQSTVLRHGNGELKALRIHSLGLNAQDRCLLEILYLFTQAKMRNKAKILIAEPFSNISMQIRGRFPYAITSGYRPESPGELFPIKHIDLQDIDLPDSCMDAILSIEVFEHLPNYKRALAESYRVLVDGGVSIFSCPFYWRTEQTTIKAQLEEDGGITYFCKPEFHGDPLRPETGILVYQIPGWNILEDIIASGFKDAAVCYFASISGGIVGTHLTGCFAFICQK